MRSERITQAGLGRLLGVDENTVHRWVRGRHRPRWEKMQQLTELSAGRVTADSFLACPAKAA